MSSIENTLNKEPMMKNYDDEFQGYRALKKEAQLFQKKKRPSFDDEFRISRKQDKKRDRRPRKNDDFDGSF
jgi:hypothetical protein